MSKKMLIDATHEEETRVAIIQDDNRLDDFDFENTVRKTLKASIFLVKVTRVEPSLQAAFVDFGGNRHGFLPFPEIHPDYYRIPIADREALIAEQEAENQAAQESEDAEVEQEEKAKAKEASKKKKSPKKTKKVEKDEAGEDASEKDVEFVGGEEDVDDTPTFKRTNIKHRYKIQEVIKRNQVMLIQVNKEERGNKGAAVSTYISLPGRYCVLMPNSPRAGGVSRKVTNQKDRQRLKKILEDLNVPDGMSVIIRTAGISRTKVEIKRDFEYLMRLWGKIRDLTLKSTAPQLVHEEGDLIMRAMRDLYRREIEEVLVEGEKGYKRARDFMKTLMPSHAKRIKQYQDDDGVPLFYRYQVEKQIDEVYSENVRLKSGGYLVINPTEALISIDVNSGKATKGRHIEETALRTNIEAAEEVARQLRLRDLGGLVVIDFIDMEDYKNNRIVERHLKDAMQRDRARIQIGRISAFGLMELSRQRMRPSLVETNFELCKHCHGVGVVRTVETSATVALRALEEEGLKGRADRIKISLNSDVALYIFNFKREMLTELEEKYGMRVEFDASPNLVKPEYQIEVLEERSEAKPLIDLSEPQFKGPEINYDTDDNGGGNRRRRRRRRGGRRRNRNNNDSNDQGNNENKNQDQNNSKDTNSGDNADQNKKDENKAENKKDEKKTSSRGRKSSRGDRKKQDAPKDDSPKEDVKGDKPAEVESKKDDSSKVEAPKAEEKPKPKKKTTRRKSKKDDDQKSEKSKDADVVNIDDQKSEKAKPKKKGAKSEQKDQSAGSEASSDDEPKKKRGGWWNRLTE